jgi:predicted transposase YbfD/YdcC
MAENPIGSIAENFSGLEDPRIERNKLHKLLDIIVIAVCGVICGADNWVDIEMFGIKKEVWLRQFLELPNGIPSHDTFGRVFGLLKADQFQECFFEWVKAVNQVTDGQVIAIDGKQLRGSMNNYLGKGAIYMVNAWANTNQVALGQRKVDAKSNEITAIPELLAMLEISGCIITIDAMGCQTEIAHQIVAQQGDYVLAVKENQGHLYEDITYLFELYLKEENPLSLVDGYHKTVDKDHGRIEIRQCWTLAADRYLQSVRRLAEWDQVSSLVLIISERRIGQQVTTQARYFISSLQPNAPKLLEAVRSHWGVENSLHWVLDMVFDEDRSRIRKDNAPQNIAVIRQMALNLLKHEKTARGGVQAKRLQAAWDENYLLKVLAV